MIKEVSTPKLKDPIFIAAWPGMGEVAYRSALFLREAMGFKMFAKLEAKGFFKPAAVTVDKGIIDLPKLAAGFFYYIKGKKGPDIIMFLGEAQPPLEYAESLSTAIIKFAKKYKVKKVFTFAAKPEAIDHKIKPVIWKTATHEELSKELDVFKLKTLTEGQISGLNGIILGVAKNNSIKGACLLAEIPFYTVQIENPKASAAILKILDKYLNLRLDVTPLIERSKFIEDEIDKLISYLKGDVAGQTPSPLKDEDVEKIKNDLAAYTKLPQSVLEKIEKFFKEAKEDIAKANELKKELDHWNVYKEYEDKFLDLFKKKDKKKGPQ